MIPSDAALRERIASAAPYLATIARADAGAALLRFESVEDLVLGMQQAALQSLEGFAWRGEEGFRAWLGQIARRHLHGRRDHWFAIRRHGGALLRLTGSGGDAPRATAIGPRTFAQRREDIELMTKALALLLPRDRDLMLWAAQGVAIDEQARRLGLSVDAARKASERAAARLRTIAERVLGR
jgi:DNA-directed RNA polymerase specialized sigma24 family protein